MNVHIEVKCEECDLSGYIEDIESTEPDFVARETEAALVAAGCVHARKRVGANEHGIYICG